MMLSEFIEHTGGFVPTDDEYSKIQDAYYKFDGDKDAFCKAWLAGGGLQQIAAARLERIRQLDGRILEIEHGDGSKCMQQEKKVEELTNRIEQLQADLDRELDWKPSSKSGTSMPQADYERRLADAKAPMDEQSAKEWLANECGFDPERIEIVPTASTYEVNKYHILRKAATYIRPPVYLSADENYFRFDCGAFMYEMVDGELRFYSC